MSASVVRIDGVLGPPYGLVQRDCATVIGAVVLKVELVRRTRTQT